MATPGMYLVNNTTNDVISLLQQIQVVRTTITRITERMEAIGQDALDTYQWPEEYAAADFLDLYFALAGKPDGSIDPLPGSIVSDDVRDKLFKLVSNIQ